MARRPKKQPPTSRHIYAYCRRSRREHAREYEWGEHSLSIETQKTRLLDFIDKFIRERFPDHTFDPARGYYIDDGVSGRLPMGERPSGARLIQAVKPGDVVVMTAWDRGFRRMLDFLTVAGEWRDTDIFMYVSSYPIDIREPLGYMLIQMIAMLAETEHRMICLRAKESMQARIRSLRSVSGSPPIGYKRVDHNGGGMYVPDYEERALCAEIVRLNEVEGMSTERISVNLWTWWSRDKKKYAHLTRRSKRPPDPRAVQRMMKAHREGYPYFGLVYADIVREQEERLSRMMSPEALEAIAGSGFIIRNKKELAENNIILPYIGKRLEELDENKRRIAGPAAEDGAG